AIAHQAHTQWLCAENALRARSILPKRQAPWMFICRLRQPHMKNCLKTVCRIFRRRQRAVPGLTAQDEGCCFRHILRWHFDTELKDNFLPDREIGKTLLDRDSEQS